MADPTIVTRFAPSPTGYLHVGGARTALFNWLLARHFGGKFLLRIEDTDVARSTEEAGRQLLEDLKWLGLHWDNDQLVYQSQRLDTYNRIIAELISRDMAYEAYESRDELAAEGAAAEAARRQFIYRRRHYSTDQVSRWRAEGRVPVIRFAMPVKEYRFEDVVLGKEVATPAVETQDFVIRKADGMPTYHFAVVVDDEAMGVTHVLRGQEHLKNTPGHIALQAALGYRRPVYGHLSIIQNLDGSKMGKRDRDKKVRQQAQNWMKNTRRTADDLATATAIDAARLKAWLADSKKQLDLGEQSNLMPVVGLKPSDLPEILVHDFRKNGYLPQVLLNFLALLGWSPGGDRERMGVEEMVQLFSVEGIGKSNAKFSRDKLLAFNTEACAAATPEHLVAAVRDYLSVNPDSPLNNADDAALATLIQMKKGFHTLRELDEICRFFFIPDDAIVYDPDAIEKVLKKQSDQGLGILRDLRSILAAVSDWKHVPLEEAAKQYGEKHQLGLGKIAQPIRVAISGGTISPPIFESLEFLGQDRTLARLERCLRLYDASTP